MAPNKIRRVEKDLLRQVALQSVGSFNGSTSQSEYRQTSLLTLLLPELWLEILSYFPKAPVDVYYPSYSDPLPDYYCHRPDALRALSQTCRTLQSFFLPMYWENLDVFTNRFGGAAHIHFATTLEARCIGLCNRPDLAAYVRVANIVLTKCSINTVMPEFGRCLAKLTNLHTLHLVHTSWTVSTAMAKHFLGLRFPSIRKLIIPAHVYELLHRCPEVRTVICTDGNANKLVDHIGSCRKIEVLGGFFIDVAHMKTLTIIAPNLCEIEIAEEVPQPFLKPSDDIAIIQKTMIGLLSVFKQLSTVAIIRILYPKLEGHWSDRVILKPMKQRDTELKDMIEHVGDILRRSDSKEENFGREDPATEELV